MYFLAAGFPIRGVRQKRVNLCADQLFDGVTKQLGHAPVDVEDPQVSGDSQIGIGRILIKVAVAGFTLLELLFGPKALQLGRRAGGENPEDEESSRFRWQRPVV